MENAQEFIAVHPDEVAAAGRSTAATTGAWRSWGHRARNQFEGASEQVVNSRLGRAFEDYAATWNPKLQVIALEVVALGENATSAANTVVNGDLDSSDQVGRQTEALRDQGSMLSRPVNSQSVPT